MKSKWEKKLEIICEDYWMEELGLAGGSEYSFLKKKLIPFIRQQIKQARQEGIEEVEKEIEDARMTLHDIINRSGQDWEETRMAIAGRNAVLNDLKDKISELKKKEGIRL